MVSAEQRNVSVFEGAYVEFCPHKCGLRIVTETKEDLLRLLSQHTSNIHSEQSDKEAETMLSSVGNQDDNTKHSCQ